MRIGIVAHHTRRKAFAPLQSEVRADFVSVDNGGIGCRKNHRAAWRILQSKLEPDEWGIVLEDDAVPIEQFCHEVTHALTYAPADIVSLYLGRQNPPQWQSYIRNALDNAGMANASWIVTHAVLHTVAIAMRGPNTIANMLAHTDIELPIEHAMTYWTHTMNLDVAYSVPSLVNHNDELPTIGDHLDEAEQRESGRVAWYFDLPQRWNTKTVGM